MGLQNFESLVAKDTSKPGCSPTISSLTPRSSTPKRFRQTFLTGQVFVGKTRPDAQKPAVDRVKSGTPDMPNFKDKSKEKEDRRFNPYPCSTLRKSDQNHSCKTESAKPAGNRLTLNLLRLPLRDLSTETGDSEGQVPAAANSVPSPLFQTAGNIAGVSSSNSGPCPSQLQSGQLMKHLSSEGRLNVTDKAQNSLSDLASPSNGSPVAPLFSPISEHSYHPESPIKNLTCSCKSPNPSKSPMAFHHNYLRKGSLPSPLSSSSIGKPEKSSDSVTKKNAAATGAKSPGPHSSLHLKKSNRDAQYSLKKTKEDKRDVYIVSSSSSEDLPSSSGSTNASRHKMVSSPSSSSGKSKKMRIHKRCSSKDVIVIDDHPVSRRRHRKSSTSSNEFEDILSSSKKQRFEEEVIDLTLLEDSPPKVRPKQVASSVSTPSRRNDPNRTPELSSSSEDGGGKRSEASTSRLQGLTPKRKALQFPTSEQSESEMTPVLSTKSIRLSLNDVADDTSDEEKESGIDGIISIVDKLAGKKDEKFYDALSESSFHSDMSVNEVEKSAATSNLKMNGNLDLVQGFTLDLNSEEDDDDVFNDDRELTPNASSGTSSSPTDTPTNPRKIESLELFVPRSLNAESVGDVTDAEPVDENVGDQGETAAEQPGNSKGMHAAMASRFDEGGYLAPSLNGECIESGVIEGTVAHPGSDGHEPPTTDALLDNGSVPVARSLGGVGTGGAVARSLGDVDKGIRDCVGVSGPAANPPAKANVHSRLVHENASNTMESTTQMKTLVETTVKSVGLDVASQNHLTSRPHAVKNGVPQEFPLASDTASSWRSTPLQEIRPVLAGRGVATKLVVEDKMDFFTLTQDNIVGNKLEDGSRLPSQRLCFVAKYLRLFTTRLRIPGAEILSQLWQLIWKPLVSGSDQLTGEAVNVCMQYLKQLLVFHPPGQHKLVNEQYTNFLKLIVGETKDDAFALWNHLESLLKCPATTRMATFLIDLLLADLWAAVTSRKSSPPLFVRLFWNGPVRNLSLPIRRLMDRIDDVAAELDCSLTHNDQIHNLMTLLYMAGTACADLSTELILRWSKLKGYTQSFLVGRICSAPLQVKLIDSLPKVKQVHAVFRRMFSSNLGAFSAKVKSVQLLCPGQEESKSSAPEKCVKADQPPPVFVCTKSKPSVVSSSEITSSKLSPSRNKRDFCGGIHGIVSLVQHHNVQVSNALKTHPMSQPPRMNSSSSCNSSSGGSCTTVQRVAESNTDLSHNSAKQLQLQVQDLRHTASLPRTPKKSPVTNPRLQQEATAERVGPMSSGTTSTLLGFKSRSLSHQCDNQPRRTSEEGSRNITHQHHHQCNNNNNNTNTSPKLHKEQSTSGINVIHSSDITKIQQEVGECPPSSPGTQTHSKKLTEKIRSKSVAEDHSSTTKSFSKHRTPSQKDHQKVRKKSKEEPSKDPLGIIPKASNCQSVPKPNPHQHHHLTEVTTNQPPLGRLAGVQMHRKNLSPAQKLWEQQLLLGKQKSRARRLSGSQTGDASKDVPPRRSSVNLPMSSRESSSVKSSAQQKVLHRQEELVRKSNAFPSSPLVTKPPSASILQDSHDRTGSCSRQRLVPKPHPKQLLPHKEPSSLAQLNTGSSHKPNVQSRESPLDKPALSKGSPKHLSPSIRLLEQQVRQRVDVPTHPTTSPKTLERPIQKLVQKGSPSKLLVSPSQHDGQLRRSPVDMPPRPFSPRRISEPPKPRVSSKDTPTHSTSSPKTPERPFQKLVQKGSPKPSFPPSQHDGQPRRSSVDIPPRPFSPRRISEPPKPRESSKDIPTHPTSSPKTPERTFQKLVQKGSPKPPSQHDGQPRRSSVDIPSRPFSPREISEPPKPRESSKVKKLPQHAVSPIALKQMLPHRVGSDMDAQTPPTALLPPKLCQQQVKFNMSSREKQAGSPKHHSAAKGGLAEKKKESAVIPHQGAFQRHTEHHQESASKAVQETASKSSKFSDHQHQPTLTMDKNKPSKKTDSRHPHLYEKHAHKHSHSSNTPHSTTGNINIFTIGTNSSNDSNNRNAKPGITSTPSLRQTASKGH